jgi:hypothetical protein
MDVQTPDVEAKDRPKLVEKPLLTRKEAAGVLGISEREWDRVRKDWNFTEVHVLSGRKGLRFLGPEVEAYIWAHAYHRPAS